VALAPLTRSRDQRSNLEHLAGGERVGVLVAGNALGDLERLLEDRRSGERVARVPQIRAVTVEQLRNRRQLATSRLSMASGGEHMRLQQLRPLPGGRLPRLRRKGAAEQTHRDPAPAPGISPPSDGVETVR